MNAEPAMGGRKRAKSTNEPENMVLEVMQMIALILIKTMSKAINHQVAHLQRELRSL